MAWTLVFLSLLTQGTGEVPRQGFLGTSKLILSLLFRFTPGLSTELTIAFILFFRFLGPVYPDSAGLSVRGSGTDSYHFLYWNQQ